MVKLWGKPGVAFFGPRLYNITQEVQDKHRVNERSITRCLFLFLGKTRSTPKEVEKTEAVTITVPGWIWAFVALIPATVMGLIAWHYKRRVEKAEKEEDDREKNKEKLEFMNVQATWAAIALAEATARAVQRIPDAKCNGDMHTALEYAEKVKHDQKDYLAKQGIHALY